MIPSQGRGTRRTPREVEERVLALAATTSMTQQEIAEAVGIPRRTVGEIIARGADDETFTRLRQEQKRAWVSQAWEAVEHLTMATVRGAQGLLDADKPLTARDVQSLAVATGIMIDKTALVMGEAGAGSGQGNAREVAEAVITAWERGREAGQQEANTIDVTPHK